MIIDKERQNNNNNIINISNFSTFDFILITLFHSRILFKSPNRLNPSRHINAHFTTLSKPNMSSTVDQLTSSLLHLHLHPDIITTQILTKLDGPSLVSTSCTSTHLHHLTFDHQLWRNIAVSTWPSITTHPKLQSLISDFPHQYQSLYSDSFPLLTPKLLIPKYKTDVDQNRADVDNVLNLVSAVDLFYKQEPIFTKVMETECDSGWFHNSPFRIDLLESKESVSVPITNFGSSSEEPFRADLEKNLTLSWVLINPSINKSVNLSSFRPVNVHRMWSTGDVEARFVTVLKMKEDEELLCRITVIFGEKEGVAATVDVRKVSMCLEDMDGRNLCGEFALAVLNAAVEFGERRRVKKGEEKERYEGYLERKRERRLLKDRRERLLDLVFIGVSVTVFVSFWGFVVFW